MTALPAATPALPDDEGALLRRAAAGEAAACEPLMRRHNRRLYRLARATLRDDVEAEDALQDAYLAAFRGLRAFRGDSSLFTWLARLVLNACRDRQRRCARRDNIIPIVSLDRDDPAGEPPGDTDRVPRPEQLLLRAEVRALLERRLDALPEALRTVFMLRCVEELSVEETARCLSIPEATVRTRQFRARARLREALAEAFDQAERDLFGFEGGRCDRVVRAVLARLADTHGVPSAPAP
jgi:RNA polymerase sigma-70 factor (ECF subfamily)